MRRDIGDDDLEQPLRAGGDGAALGVDVEGEDLGADVPGDGAEGDAEGEGEDVHHRDADDAAWSS